MTLDDFLRETAAEFAQAHAKQAAADARKPRDGIVEAEASGGKPTKCPRCEATSHLIALAKSLVLQAFEEGFYAGMDNAETEQFTGIAGKVSECFGASKTWSRLGEIFGRADVATNGASQ